jgi:type IV fimbrial biogenesis protein FimT
MKFYGPLRRFPQPLRRLRGFTLVELMVVVAIAAILALIAAPYFTETVNRARRKTYANQLFEDLALARNEAIKRGVPVTVCPSTDGENCEASDSWVTGWIVFVDVATTGARDVATEALLKVHEPLANGWSATKNGSNQQYVTYGPLGTPIGVGTFTLAICPPSAVCTTVTKPTPTNQTHLVRSTLGRVHIDSYD